MVLRKVTNAVFLNFVGRRQPPLDKNSEDLAILILEFDDVSVKTIYCFFLFLSGVQKEVHLGVYVLYRPCSRPIKISPHFHARQSLNYRKHN